MADFNTKAVFQNLHELIITPLISSMDKIIHNFSSSLALSVKLMAIILIVFYGYRFILEKGTLSANDVVGIICKIVIVTMLVTKAGEFNYYVKDLFFTHLPNEISNILSSEKNISGNIFDRILNAAIGKTQNLESGLGWTDVSGRIACWVIAIAIALFCGAGFFVQTIAKIGLSIVIALGPLFIALYMWETTKKFTEAWISQVANFVILQILVATLVTLTTNIFVSMMDAEWQSATEILPIVVVLSLFSKALFLALPFIASALATGGASFTAATTNPFKRQQGTNKRQEPRQRIAKKT